MIDEKKLIDEIEDRRRYWENYAAEYDEAGDEINMDICDGKAIELHTIIKHINEQPKVGEWIPCSEWMSCNARLPKYGEDVEVTTKDGDRLIGHYAGGCWYDSIDWNYIRVAAWKEPSEPWEGGKE